MPKHRFVLVIPYLLITAVCLCFAFFVADDGRDLFDLPISELLSLVLTLPWSFLILAVLRLAGLESDLAWVFCMAAGVAANTAILYYLGLKFERAPERLV